MKLNTLYLVEYLVPWFPELSPSVSEPLDSLGRTRERTRERTLDSLGRTMERTRERTIGGRILYKGH